MPKCAIKRGFLMLRECAESTSKLCPECGRGACEEHMVMDAAGKSWTCVDCHGRREEEPGPERIEDNPAAWRHGYRDSYYRDHHYAPYYYGAYYDSYYDDYDVRAFDREMAEPGDIPAEEGGPDFMDS